MSDRQMSLDEQAARAAETMFAKGGNGSGDLPMGRSGDNGAEGGFTSAAGGSVMDENGTKKATDKDGFAFGKSGKTGADMNSEPGRMGETGKTGSKMTSEPGAEAGGGAGEPAQVSQNDDSVRSRKAGQVGVSGGSVGSGMNEDEDGFRSRKAGKVGMSKADDEEDEEEMDGEEEDAEKGCKKSIDAADLLKSLDVLEQVASGAADLSVPRREELAAKLSDGSLTKSEMLELSELMKAGVVDDDDEFEKSDDSAIDWDDDSETYQEQFAADEELSKGYEVSEYLERQSQMTASALDQVQETLTKALGDAQERNSVFNVGLAKSLRGLAQLNIRQERMIAGQQDLIKSLAERLETVENTPMPRRAAVGQAQLLHKSMVGEVGPGQGGLSKSDVMDTLDQMAMRGVESTPSGQRVDYAMALVENGEEITKSLYNDVVSWRQQNSGTVRVN